MNHQGERFRKYAEHIVRESEQAISAFGSVNDAIKVKVAGPSVLLQHFLPLLTNSLPTDLYALELKNEWEGDAMRLLQDGTVHLSLLTGQTNASVNNDDIHLISLGKTVFKVLASASHPLFNAHPDGCLDSEQLRTYPFACPSVSPFCGIKMGLGSDGWRDDKIPRTIRFRCDDFSTLISLIQRGTALAYVPEFCAEQFGLSTVNVVDCEHSNAENMVLAFKKSQSPGWLNRLTDSIQHAFNQA